MADNLIKLKVTRVMWGVVATSAVVLMLLMNWHQLPIYRPAKHEAVMLTEGWISSKHGWFTSGDHPLVTPQEYALPAGTHLIYYDSQLAETTLPDGRLVRGTPSWMDAEIMTPMGERLQYDSSIPDIYGTWSEGLYFTSEQHLHDKFIGKTFQEIDDSYRLTDDYSPLDSGRAVSYISHIGMLRENGHFCHVAVWFNADGKCDSISHTSRIDKSNTWWLKILPGVQTILGWDWLTWFVQESPYGADDPSFGWLMRLCYNIMWWLLVLLWFILPMLLPAAIYNAALPLEKLYKCPLWLLTLPSIIATIAWGYVWLVAMLAWGVYWWVAVPLGCIVVFYICIMSVGVPASLRCPHCGRVGCYNVIETVYARTLKDSVINYQEIGFDHKVTGLPYTKEETFTEKKESLYDGKHLCYHYHEETYEVTYVKDSYYYKYACYQVDYETPVYRDYYECSSCKYKDDKERKGERKEVKRTRLADQVRFKENTEREIKSRFLRSRTWSE